MKSRRLLIIGGVVALLIVGLVAAAFSSAVQTWAVQRALAGQPELGLSVGRVSAGFNHVDLTDVRFVRAGLVLTVPSAQVDLPVLQAWSHKLTIQRLVAHGWTLDFSPTNAAPPKVAVRAAHEFSFLPSAFADQAAAPDGPLVFKGIFNHLSLPFDLALDGVDLAGEIVLPAVEQRPAARVKASVNGGGLAAGHPGKFDYEAVVGLIGDDVPVRSVTIRGTLGAVMATPRALTRFVASTEAEAVGPKFPQGVKLTVDVSAARSAHGESYAISVASGSKQLAAAETSFPAGASHLEGSWRLDMRDADLAPFSFGRELPAFEAAGEGRFETDTAFLELRASGKLNAALDRLRVIDEQLSGVGAVRVSAEFDFAQRGAATRVDRLDIAIENPAPVATVRALQAFEFNFRTGELNVADPSSELLGVAFDGLPLTWLAPYFATEGYAVVGDGVHGALAASARNGGFTLRAKTPLTIGGLGLARTDGTALLAGVDVSLSAAADYTPQGWQVEVAPLEVRSAAGSILALEAKVGCLSGKDQPIKAAGSWTGNLPALLGQPIASGYLSLSSGDAQGSFVASVGAKREGALKLALSHLATPKQSALPAVSLDLRADRDPDGKITFNAPVQMERDGRKSDVTLAGTLIPGPASTCNLDMRVLSDFLAVEDAQVLAAPFAVGASSGTAATAPAWAGVNGQVALSLKKVQYNKQFLVTNCGGLLRIDGGQIKLVDGRGGYDPDGEVKLAGAVTFRPKSAEPYSLAAEFEMNNISTVPAFRAIDATRSPTLEAQVNLVRKLTGTGATLHQLIDHAGGDLQITSKGGIFRGMAADFTERIQKTQSRVMAIANFLGVLPDDYVNKTKILSDIAKALAEIPFDQFSVTAARDAANNLQLVDFTLISPELRVAGDGQITNVPQIPLLAQPMELRLNLGARGKLGDLIKRAGLLEGRTDSLGYAAFSVPLRIGGTAANPDTNEIRNALQNSALERSGLLDSLLGK